MAGTTLGTSQDFLMSFPLIDLRNHWLIALCLFFADRISKICDVSSNGYSFEIYAPFYAFKHVPEDEIHKIIPISHKFCLLDLSMWFDDDFVFPRNLKNVIPLSK